MQYFLDVVKLFNHFAKKLSVSVTVYTMCFNIIVVPIARNEENLEKRYKKIEKNRQSLVVWRKDRDELED